MLMASCTKDPEPAPVAGFQMEGGECTAPCAISFLNTSENATSYTWHFGDGSADTITTTTQKISHLYQQEGVYYVTLIAKAADGRTDTATAEAIARVITPKQLLTARPYLITDIIREEDGQVQSIWSAVAACEQDNLYIFHPNRTFEESDAGQRCPDHLNFPTIWSLDQNNRYLVLETNVSRHVYLIEALDATVLKLSYEEGGLRKFTITYTPQ